MGKNDGKAKSGRKPLRDVSNGRKPSKPVKKKTPEAEDRVEDDALDRLLLVQSDLSTLIHQIDELVVQAFKVKATSKQGRKELESFMHVLSEILSSLKPWVPRFQQALSSPSMESEDQLGRSLASEIVPAVTEDESNVVKSPDPTNLDSLVSPSPLVSWRADCTVERGRQLFLLTPLPRSKALSSKQEDTSKSVLGRITSNTIVGLPSLFSISRDTNDDLLDGVAIKPSPSKLSDSVATEMRNTLECGFVSPSNFSKRDRSMLVMTPCVKMSPPKSCVLLEPISESFFQDDDRVHKGTPYPVGSQNYSGSQISEPSSTEVSEDLTLKYPELLGIQPTHKFGIGRKDVEPSLDWFMSPPKSCVLMEPPEEKLINNAFTSYRLPITAAVFNQQTNLSSVKDNNIQGGCHSKLLGSCLALMESTPMWKEPESTICRGKRPGETTLKKELWTKFEAASTNEVHFDASVIRETTQKGFLARLDEVSCDETSSVAEGLG
ncbi:hypothetical protein L1049_004180 [Liquidambar formosana]|uniref:Uncharacterized protein n=1 Tax=Liquidambar formosana TaxID=63359 RepID=A0AAP0RNM2_LIQFO